MDENVVCDAPKKIPRFCTNCGKPLFKYYVTRQENNSVFVKIEMPCSRESCTGLHNRIELKIDLENRVT